MAGVPLLNGFLSKEMFFAEAVAGAVPLGACGWLVPVAATLGGIFSVAYSLRFVHDVFFNGAAADLPNPHPHEPPRWMKVPVDAAGGRCACVVGLCAGADLRPAGARRRERRAGRCRCPTTPRALARVQPAAGDERRRAGRRRARCTSRCSGQLRRCTCTTRKGWTGRLLFTQRDRRPVRCAPAASRSGSRTARCSATRRWMVGSAVALAALAVPARGAGRRPGTGARSCCRRRRSRSWSGRC